MSVSTMTMLVTLASYGFVSTLLALVVCAIWASGVHHRLLTANQLLALRLLPAVGGIFVTVTMVVPAFVRYEPSGDGEVVGPVVLGMSFVTLLLVAGSALRVLRGRAATRSLSKQWPTVARHSIAQDLSLEVIAVATPIVAVIGVRRPRFVVAEPVVSACTAEELERVAAHEQAHLAARDNVKRLLIAASPDVLAWLPLGRTLADSWHIAAEHEADNRAAADPESRLVLASALIKVARLAVGSAPVPRTASTLIGVDGIESRVRRLMSSRPVPPPVANGRLMSAGLVLLAGLAVFAHQRIYYVIEATVSLGR